MSASQVTAQTGNGTVTLGFTLSSTSLSSLSFAFNDNSNESNRSITIEKVTINNYEIATSTYILNDGGQLSGNQAIINKGESLEININALDYVFGQDDAELSDLGTVTLQGTSGAEKLVKSS